MLFNSFLFILVFLPTVVLLWYFLLDKFGLMVAKVWLLTASLIFYGSYKPAYLPVLLGSVAFNWIISRGFASIAAGSKRAAMLKIGITGNLMLLMAFKYFNFVVSVFGHPAALGSSRPDWEFPLGISFFTLQQIMYLVDSYEELSPANNLLDHATFVSFFPYVTSGPITRSKTFMPQLTAQLTLRDRSADIAGALTIFAVGLFKKVILADSFARFADLGFGNVGQLSALEAWISMLAFTMQLYFDFSGYSDMAVGAALMIGIDLPRNFNAPYLALTMTEFWQRWHITLSNFITTYLYTPLIRVFRRATVSKSALATVIAMAIVGLWHGPAWTFIIFGLLHGIGLAANQYWKRKSTMRLPRSVAWAATFLYVNVAFVFFRASSLSSALVLLHRLVVAPSNIDVALFRTEIRGIELGPIAAAVIVGTIAAFFGPTSDSLQRQFVPGLRMACFVTALLLVSCLFLNSNLAKEFVYFAF